MADTSSGLDVEIGAPSRRRRPLRGVTITLVEDNPSASESIRLLAVASGARLRRADSLNSAGRHLAIYRPNVVIIDIGLPDGDGLDLVSEIAAMPAPRPGVIVVSGGDPADWEDDALAAGAGATLVKPVDSMDDFVGAVRSVLPDDRMREGGIFGIDAIAVQAAKVG